MTIALIVGLLVLFVLNVPIAWAMLAASVGYLLVHPDIPLITVPQRVVAGTDHYLLLAIPFFFLAAELMNRSGMMENLVRVAMAMVGHIRGGLGHVSVVSNMLLAGISGSAVADAAGLGRLQIELMKKGGYGAGFAAAIGGSASTIGPVIPPSIPFVIYGGIAGVSIGDLFLAGVVPGALMGAFLMGAVYVIARRRSYPMTPWTGWRELGLQTWRSLPALLLPVLILGGILSGAFTPTEAAAVAAVFAFSVGMFLMRTLRWGDLMPALKKVGADTARLMIIIAVSSLFAWILARERVPQQLADFFLSISREPWIVLLLINILLLILGCFLEPVVILILIVPILAPLTQEVGIDPVHFGVVLTLNLMIGLLTPPVGTVMFIMMGMAKIRMETFVREAWPFIVALLAVLGLITYVPWLVLALPNAIGHGGG
jgi:C4-dicarboxylate transporter DctM subunit